MNNSSEIFGTLNKSAPTIYIGNLKYSRDEKGIGKLFSRYGVVSYVKCVQDSKTKKNKGFAFVQLKNKNSVDQAVEGLNGKVIDGRTLKVSIAKENEEKPFYQTRTPKPASNGPEKKAVKKRKRKESGLKTLFNYLGK